MSPIIDHPLLEAQRVVTSGWLDPEFRDRAMAEWRAGPRTAERLRAAMFELMGPGFRGRVPVAIEEIFDLDDAEGWRFVLGYVDEGSVLGLADGSWFGLGNVDEAAINRKAVVFSLTTDDAEELQRELAEGREPVWALDPLTLLDLGDERSLRETLGDA